jgi:hypothetical protein
MNDFLIHTYQPTLSTHSYLNEFNNKNYFDVNKFIAANDNEGLSYYFNSLYKSDNIFDTFFSLLYLRSLCVGSKLKLQLNKETTLSINILNILQRLIDNPQQPLEDFTHKDLTIKFKLPSRLYNNNIITFLFDSINDLRIDKNIENFKELNDKQKLLIIKNLKQEIILDIKNHIKERQTRYSIVQLDDITDFNNYKFSFYDNSAFFTLKFFFKNNISHLYNKLYHCIQKLNLPYSDYLGLTPSETNILLTIYKKSNNIK